jgi:3-phosphoshikimate 1-carboxyvinyltransferase
MRVIVHPGGPVGGVISVPGDKSIAHRWLILAATAVGTTGLHDLPPSLDVRSTARCLSRLVPSARDALEAWATESGLAPDGDGFTFNKGEPRPASTSLTVAARGRGALEVPAVELDCENSGTTMRLLAGVLAPCPFSAVLTGDESLRARPMERVAVPLRGMGATVETVGGHAPVRIDGGPLRGIMYPTPVPSAQVKGAVLFAGLAAEGSTTVEETAPTRDHTERALAALGAPIRTAGGAVSVSAFQHGGFEAIVPGDVSSAAFLVAAAVLTGSELVVRGVGLNPSRMGFLEVMARMGVRVERRVTGEELGEPVGELTVAPSARLVGITVEPSEVPLLIDEIPVLAVLAANADGGSRFLQAGELRVKESDRLGGLVAAIRAVGGEAAVEGDDLVLAGGGLRGGSSDVAGDHRMAMAMAVAGLAARGPVEVRGMDAAEVSFPGFVGTLRALGARIEG